MNRSTLVAGLAVGWWSLSGCTASPAARPPLPAPAARPSPAAAPTRPEAGGAQAAPKAWPGAPAEAPAPAARADEITPDAAASPVDVAALGREVVTTVRHHFVDATRADAWATRHADYAARVTSRPEFDRLTRALLAELKTSHTDYLSPREPLYYGLLAVFQAPLQLGAVRYDSIGADVASLPEGYFVRVLFAGGPAERAGLKRGDRVVAVDGEPFEPSALFGRAGREVTLTVERVRGAAPVRLRLTPRRLNPKDEWVEAQQAGMRIIEHRGAKVAYAPLFSCAGAEPMEALQDAMAGKFQSAQALVIDFRDGWGGCSPEFLNVFNCALPALTSTRRDGGESTYDPPWRKPVFVLVNGGSRSGKEVVAFAVQKHKIGALVGERTAGAVMAGKPFLLSDRSALYLAVEGVRVDGTRLEGNPVVPDVPVADTLRWAQGRDPQLERALDLAASAPGKASPRERACRRS